ncbi:MAG: exonuclease SbcCD subunit D [Nitrolancea sp.]
MKFLHFADLHLGIDNYGTLNPRTGLSTRIDDFLRSFDAIIDAAIERNVDAVLFAGDAFKNRDPSPTLQRMFAARIRRLAEAEIPTVLLSGNHDLPSIAARATAIDIYETLAIPHIHPARSIDVINLPTKSGALQVVTLPWIPRNTLAANEELRGLTTDEQMRRIGEIVADTMREMTSDLDRSLPAVLLGHLSIEGARLGSEQSIMLGRELVLSPEELSVDAFSYVALGHIHRHQSVGTHPPIVYAGSPERVDFGEERETKGYVLVDIDRSESGGWQASWTFEPLPTRPFLTLQFEARTEDPMAEIQHFVERREVDIQGSIVRMSVKIAPEREDQVRVDEIRRWLQQAGAAWVARVTRDVESLVRPRVDIREDEALNPETMLDRWLSMRDLPDSTRQRVREAGLDLIRNERETSTQ